jgi:TatD DNase family protein
VRYQVVNGTRLADWPGVADLAVRHREILPSFGFHPWYLPERSGDWLGALERQLDTAPGAMVGEIGIDRWWLELSPSERARRLPSLGNHEPAPLSEQLEVFAGQLRLAVDRDLPVTIHCLRAWGPLLSVLRSVEPQRSGFLLHSYSGPAELIPDLVRLGGRFSFSGYFLHDRKAAQRDVFRQVPRDRLLVETDAPDQSLPMARVIQGNTGAGVDPSLNHPGNLPAVYAGLAETLECPLGDLVESIAENFATYFRVPRWLGPRGVPPNPSAPA